MDCAEIAHAKWFGVNDLPSMPSRISIARELIDWYIKNYSDSF